MSMSCAAADTEMGPLPGAGYSPPPPLIIVYEAPRPVGEEREDGARDEEVAIERRVHEPAPRRVR
jgi:hypothetical protein